MELPDLHERPGAGPVPPAARRPAAGRLPTLRRLGGQRLARHLLASRAAADGGGGGQGAAAPRHHGIHGLPLQRTSRVRSSRLLGYLLWGLLGGTSGRSRSRARGLLAATALVLLADPQLLRQTLLEGGVCQKPRAVN